MWGRGNEPDSIELNDLAPELAATLERMLVGQEVPVTRDGETIGTLLMAPTSTTALEGIVLPDEGARAEVPRPDGVAVVATAMKLDAQARERLSAELGEDYIVLDLLEAPSTADVLLTHPVSPQLIGRLRGMFPQARVVVAEIDDDELGVSYTGPVARLMDAGAEAYLPPRPVERIGRELGAFLEGTGSPQLARGARTPPQIEAAEE